MPDFEPPNRPVWAEISATRLRENYGHLLAAANGMPVLAVVKANAYGHGAAQCAPVLAAAGARWLGVTSVTEGVLVRRALGILPQGLSPRLLVMCGLWPGEEAACLDHGLTPVVWEPYHLDLLEAEAHRRHLPPGSVPVHVEIDTGMARQGVLPGPHWTALLARFSPTSPLQLEGILTHFASAECPHDRQNLEQRQRFEAALERTRAARLQPALLHAGNTSGIDAQALLPWLTHLAATFKAKPMTRAGLALYGHALPLQPPGLHPALSRLHPVLAWKTRVVSLRDVAAGATIGYNATFTAPHRMRLALLPVGYADGFRRALSSTNAKSGGHVLILGRRAPLLGRISMDLAIADVTHLPSTAIGDEAILLGTSGTETIRAEEHAALAQTSAYEILCGISDRVPRHLTD